MRIVAPAGAPALHNINVRGDGSSLFAGMTGLMVGNSRLHRRPLPDTGEPRGDMAVGGIERLADHGAEIEEAIEQYVGEREALAADVVAVVGELCVEPLQAVRRDHLQPRRG